MEQKKGVTIIDMTGENGSKVIQNLTGCSAETASQFVAPPPGWDVHLATVGVTPPRPHIRLERAEMAAQREMTDEVLAEFEDLYHNYRSVCDLHVSMYKALDWKHFKVFKNKKDAAAKALCANALFT